MPMWSLGRDKFSLYASPRAEDPSIELPGVQRLLWSEDGNRLFVNPTDDPSRIDVFDGKTITKLSSLPSATPLIQWTLSPRGTYLIVRYKGDPSSHPKNVHVWEVSSEKVVDAFTLRTTTRGGWPCIKWSEDESVAARLVASGVQILSGRGLGRDPLASLELKNVASVDICPTSTPQSCRMLVFQPEMKGSPSKLLIYNMQDNSTPILMSTKSCFTAQECSAKWSKDGSSVLALTSTDVDASGKSYYGSTSLFWFGGDGSKSALIVAADKGPVSAFEWCPTTCDFIVCSGSTPANLSLYDGKTGNRKLSFGESCKNSIYFNRFGRFVAFGGFGNLAGELDFWDLNKKRRIGTCSARNAVKCEWAPDGRHFLTCTTAPRMRVDNGIRIFYYDGTELSNLKFDELNFSGWVPNKGDDEYTDRPPTPGRVRPDAQLQQESKPGVYRPPGCPDGGVFSMRDAPQTRAEVVSALPKAGGVPGLTGATQSKSAKKNAKRKAKKAEGGA